MAVSRCVFAVLPNGWLTHLSTSHLFRCFSCELWQRLKRSHFSKWSIIPLKGNLLCIFLKRFWALVLKTSSSSFADTLLLSGLTSGLILAVCVGVTS